MCDKQEQRVTIVIDGEEHGGVEPIKNETNTLNAGLLRASSVAKSSIIKLQEKKSKKCLMRSLNFYFVIFIVFVILIVVIFPIQNFVLDSLVTRMTEVSSINVTEQTTKKATSISMSNKPSVLFSSTPKATTALSTKLTATSSLGNSSTKVKSLTGPSTKKTLSTSMTNSTIMTTKLTANVSTSILSKTVKIPTTITTKPATITATSTSRTNFMIKHTKLSPKNTAEVLSTAKEQRLITNGVNITSTTSSIIISTPATNSNITSTMHYTIFSTTAPTDVTPQEKSNASKPLKSTISSTTKPKNSFSNNYTRVDILNSNKFYFNLTAFNEPSSAFQAKELCRKLDATEIYQIVQIPSFYKDLADGIASKLDFFLDKANSEVFFWTGAYFNLSYLIEFDKFNVLMLPNGEKQFHLSALREDFCYGSQNYDAIIQQAKNSFLNGRCSELLHLVIKYITVENVACLAFYNDDSSPKPFPACQVNNILTKNFLPVSPIRVIQGATLAVATSYCTLASYPFFSDSESLKQFFNHYTEHLDSSQGQLFWTAAHYDLKKGTAIMWNNDTYGDPVTLWCPDTLGAARLKLHLDVLDKINGIVEIVDSIFLPLVWDSRKKTEENPQGCLRPYIDDVLWPGRSVLPGLCFDN